MMVLSLLLMLLLRESLGDEVCLSISDYAIITNGTYGDILERRNGTQCEINNLHCVFDCTFSMIWPNISSTCLEAQVNRTTTKIEYIFENNSSCSIYYCTDTSILPLIESLGCNSSDQRGMMKLYYIRDSCALLFSSNHGVKKLFLKVEREMIHSIMKTSQPKAGSPINYSLNVLSLHVVNISDSALKSVEPNLNMRLEAPQLLPQNMSFVPTIWLPVNALYTIPKENRIIGLVSYMHHSQFQFNQEDISSMVIRIELLGKHPLCDLSTPIKMNFTVTTQTFVNNTSKLLCHYFDENGWRWRTNGCENDNGIQNDQNDIICNCNHATPFAVLLIRESIGQIHWEILSYISYIGCGLSAFFTALSLVIYVFSRNHRIDYSTSIHVSLSGALLLLNTTFLLTEWGARVKPDWICMFVAALMHYSLLCCFTWMAIEALHLYLLLLKVFNTYYKHYLLKLSFAGWGIPGVIVAVFLGVKDYKQFYGVTHMTMADTNQTNAICWITDDTFFYSLNLIYFTLIFIFNSGILVAVASSMCKMKRVLKTNSKIGAKTEGKSWIDSDRFSASCKSGLTLLGLTCLVGTTWGLAFLGSGYVNYPILYLFCILNSTQGFFIFVWICLSTKKQKKRAMEEKCTSTPVRTSELS